MKIKLIHWDEQQCKEKSSFLESLGHNVDSESLRDKETFKRTKENPPDVFIIDLSKLPSHGREIAVGLRNIKSTQNVPFIFTEGETDKVEKVKSVLPDEVFCGWKTIRSALKKAASQKDTVKKIPLAMMERYTETPLFKKLGIKEGYKVSLFNPPKDFKNIFKDIPVGTKLLTKLKEDSEIIIWFVLSRSEFEKDLSKILKCVDKNMLWVATRKKSSGIKTDINQITVRQAGLKVGLVDYKICSINEIWSGLLFRRRKK